MESTPRDEEPHESPAPAEKPAWVKPEITSFLPVTEARGISYTPTDGISNLTP